MASKSSPKKTKNQALEKRLGYTFKDKTLLDAALTHRSAGHKHNERLEFLGDAVLNFTIALELYSRFSEAREGDMTRFRAHLVKSETLGLVARELKLGDYIQLGSGERKAGGHQRESILADALEAIMGAILLDAGEEAAQKIIVTWFEKRLNELKLKKPYKDPKTRLQEVLQADKKPLPEYKVITVAGDAHEPLFKVSCIVAGLKAEQVGEGHSRRKAEQEAAALVLKALGYD